MSISKEPPYQKYSSDYGSLEIQTLKGDSAFITSDTSGHVDLTNAPMLHSFLATATLSSRDDAPLLFTRTDMQGVTSLAINHDSVPRNLTNRMHCHNYFALSIIASGSVEIQIENRRIRYRAGDVVILNRNTRHAEELLQNATLYDIELSRDYLLHRPETDELFTHMDETQHQFFSKNLDNESKRNRNFIECRYLGDPFHIEILDIFLKIADELEHKRSGFQLMISALTYRLFALLSDPATYSSIYIDLGFDGGERLAIRTKQFLDKTKRKISRTELSESLHYSSAHINRVFQKYYGESATDYNRKILLQEAARLLDETNMSIQDIMIEIGFGNRTYFYRLFFEMFQMTPAEYRRRNTAEADPFNE